MYKTGGLTTEAKYPYTSYFDVTGECSYKGGEGVVSVDGYYTIKGETNMKDFVMTTGPLSVCLDASSWSTYTGGVLSTCGKELDHCVQAVGVNTAEGYWKIRNSWGTDWGDKGYIYLKYGSNTCGVALDATYTEVSKSSSANNKSEKSSLRKVEDKKEKLVSPAIAPVGI